MEKKRNRRSKKQKAKKYSVVAYRQEFRLDFAADGIDLNKPPKSGYFAFNYELIGAPPEEVNAHADASAHTAPDVADDYQEHLDHCGYDAGEGGDFIDDSHQTAAALQVRNATRVSTVLSGFYVNQGKLLCNAAKVEDYSGPSRRAAKPTAVELQQIIDKIKEKAQALQLVRYRNGERKAILKRIPKALDKLLSKADQVARQTTTTNKRPHHFFAKLLEALPDEVSTNALMTRLKMLELSSQHRQSGRRRSKAVSNFKKWAKNRFQSAMWKLEEQKRFCEITTRLCDLAKEQNAILDAMSDNKYRDNFKVNSMAEVKEGLFASLQDVMSADPASLRRRLKAYQAKLDPKLLTPKRRGTKGTQESPPPGRTSKPIKRKHTGTGDNVDVSQISSERPRYIAASPDGRTPARGWDFPDVEKKDSDFTVKNK